MTKGAKGTYEAPPPGAVLLTARQAAQVLGVSENTVWNLAKTGQLTKVKGGLRAALLPGSGAPRSRHCGTSGRGGRPTPTGCASARTPRSRSWPGEAS